jgi:predicted DNA-binding transcriptional regulator AlpA
MSKRKQKIKPAAVTVSVTVELLNDEQAAALLGVEPRTLRLWRNTRALPHIRITPKVIRYRRTDINAWLDRSRTVIAA